MASPYHAPVGQRIIQDQDPAAASPHRVPAGPRFVQDLAVTSPCSVSVGHISNFDHIAESPSSSEKVAVVTDVPPGLASRPPVVSPSSTSGVSVSIFPRASSGLIYSRTGHRSAAAAGTRRPPVDYGSGRRPPPTTTSRPPSPQRRPPTPGSKPAAQRPATTQRRVARRASSPSTATSPSSPQPELLAPSQTTDSRSPPPPPPPPALQASPRLPEPVVGRIDDLHLRSCVERCTREQRAEPLCSAIFLFLSLGLPSSPPDDILDYIPSTRRPPRAKVLSLATKGLLHTNDYNIVILVHRPHTDSTRRTRRACTPPPPPLAPPPRVYVPMLMRPWVLHPCHSITSHHLGVSRAFSMLMRFYW